MADVATAPTATAAQTQTAGSRTMGYYMSGAVKVDCLFDVANFLTKSAANQYALGVDGSAAAPALTFGSDTDTGLYRIAANTFGFAAGATAVMRIDTLGLRVGTTTANLAGERFTIFSNADGAPSFLSRYNAGANSPYLMIRHLDGSYLSRLDANGGAGIAQLSLAIKNVDALLVDNNRNVTLTGTGATNLSVKGGSSGSYILRTHQDSAGGGWGVALAADAPVDTSTYKSMIYMNATAQELWLSTGGVHRIAVGSSGIFRPLADNTQSLGQSSLRWSVVYAGTGTINTSDGREKSAKRAFTTPELAAAKRIAGTLGIFQFLDAIAEKGEDGARLHTGVIAQDVWAIMADEGLIDPIAEGVRPDSRYAFLCYDEWDAVAAVEEVLDEGGNVVTPAQAAQPSGNRFGVRPDQLALFLIAAQEARLAALEAAS